MSLRRPAVLVVEDNAHVAKGVERGLVLDGYHVTVALSGDDGRAMASSGNYDLMVLDLMLPGVAGLDILKELRGHGSVTPVLVLTARDTLDDRLSGFREGADDYLVKPFALPELLARVRALLHRSRASVGTLLRVADLEVNLVSRRCARGGRAIDLAPKEFELLAYLMTHAGRVVTREMLGHHVWNVLSRGTPLDNVIDVHIGRLRRKIDVEGAPKLIRTVRGMGFEVAGP